MAVQVQGHSHRRLHGKANLWTFLNYLSKMQQAWGYKYHWVTTGHQCDLFLQIKQFLVTSLVMRSIPFYCQHLDLLKKQLCLISRTDNHNIINIYGKEQLSFVTFMLENGWTTLVWNQATASAYLSEKFVSPQGCISLPW